MLTFVAQISIISGRPKMAKSLLPRLKITKLLFNKYTIVFVVFIVFVTFFDNHSLIHRWETHRRIVEMEKELKYYQKEIKDTRQKTNELRSNRENLEKFAREHYYMKKESEDIYIIKE